MRKASKTERGWRRRYEFSVSVAQQGDWEQRLDQRANIYFFHRLARPGDSHYEEPETELLGETCQWEIPVTWSGDVLLTSSQKDLLKDTLDPSLSTGNGAGTEAAFTQPSEIWLPHEGEGKKKSGGTGDDRTPGVRAAGVVRSGQNKGGSRIGTGEGAGGSGLVGFSSSLAKPSIDAHSAKPHSSLTVGSGGKTFGSVGERPISEGMLAEDLLLNDDIVYALARRLGLPTEKIVPASQLPSVFTMSQQDGDSISQYQPFTSLQSSTSFHEGNSSLLPLTLTSSDRQHDPPRSSPGV